MSPKKQKLDTDFTVEIVDLDDIEHLPITQDWQIIEEFEDLVEFCDYDEL